MLIFHVLSVLIYLTSVLTITVNATSNVEGTLLPTLTKLFEATQPKTKAPGTLLTVTRSISNDETGNVQGSDTQSRPTAKGGPSTNLSEVKQSEVALSKSSANATIVAEGVSLSAKKIALTFDKNISEENGTRSSVVPRKGVSSKIAPRKGVDFTQDINYSDGTESTNEDLLLRKTSNVITNATHVSTVVTEPTASVIENTKVKNYLNDTASVFKIDIPGNKSIPNVLLVSSHPNISMKAKPKPKPTVTIGEDDDDDPIPASATKTMPLGLPQKIDYIVPVVITVMAVPLLGVAAFILYSRGRDCWDKRHYRRMDFLIDGMYND